ncbi:MAG TPA: hypothetical protein DCE41_33455 [Cytophagales bacterium]|nr:hypothetical protein [Cytophagales bacterium]HAA19399.1 hypothetical protein [Cytophagales bacterium]HAP61272.1 hypothetical protein [Cytophagales bacterium]
MSSVEVTIKGKSTINLSGIDVVKDQCKVLDRGWYKATLSSSIYFNKAETLPLKQVFLFSGSPATTEEFNQWYFLLTEGGEVVFYSDGEKPIYTFAVDKVSSADNTGEATVTFTPLSS